MPDHHSKDERTSPGGKTTFTFRVQPDIKLELAERARSLGLSPSQYVEAIVVKCHYEHVRNDNSDTVEQKLTLSADQADVYQSLLTKLSQQFPDHTTAEIITACLAHALENAGALWQRSMKTFLRRIKEGYYHHKIEKNDN